MIIEVGKNVLDCDVAATVAAFAASTRNECDCDVCRNFRAAQDRVFPPPILRVLTQFGIDPTKPAEIYNLGPPDQDSVLRYGGWFHVVGCAINDDDIVDLSPDVKVYFLKSAALAPPSFKGQPLVQIEFEMKIPWLLPEPWKT